MKGKLNEETEQVLQEIAELKGNSVEEVKKLVLELYASRYLNLVQGARRSANNAKE